MKDEQWNITSDKVENQVDSMLAILKNAGADDQLRIAVDRVFRSYVRWLYAVRVNNVRPADAYTTVVHLINGMVLETMVQLASRDEKGDKISPRQWTEDFILELIANLDIDLKKIESTSGPH